MDLIERQGRIRRVTPPVYKPFVCEDVKHNSCKRTTGLHGQRVGLLEAPLCQYQLLSSRCLR